MSNDLEDCPTLLETDEVVSSVPAGSGPENKNSSEKIPVTIITGFLGAGKTTFLNHVLHDQHGKRIVVIQNEFGLATGVDEAMVFGADGSQQQQWLELPNGCICCTVKGDFVKMLETLIERKSSFDYVFIETDGLADPGPVASVFWLDEAVESPLFLDGILAVADANLLPRQLADSTQKKAAIRQLASADSIILNKTDLLQPTQLDSVLALIRTVNTVGPIHLAVRGKLVNGGLANVLDLQAFSQRSAVREVDDIKKSVAGVECSVACDCSGHEHGHGHVGTVAIEEEGVVDKKKLEGWLADLLWIDEEEKEEKLRKIFRVKGIVAAREDGEDGWYSLQGVGELFEVEKLSLDRKERSWEWTKDGWKSRFVVIGFELDQDLFQTSFRSLKV